MANKRYTPSELGIHADYQPATRVARLDPAVEIPPVTVFTFTVVGTPVGKGRARVTMRGTFTPKRTRDYEALIADYAALILPWGWPKDKAYRLTVRYTGRRSDGDNILKAVADALQGITYNNDRQIDEHVAIRLNDKPPRTEVTVEIL